MDGGDDHMNGTARTRSALVQKGMISLFEDTQFSGDLLTRMVHLCQSEEEMDLIYKRAEDEILGFASALADSGVCESAHEALEGYIFRLKRQILRNPSIYVEGS